MKMQILRRPKPYSDQSTECQGKEGKPVEHTDETAAQHEMNEEARKARTLEVHFSNWYLFRIFKYDICIFWKEVLWNLMFLKLFVGIKISKTFRNIKILNYLELIL